MALADGHIIRRMPDLTNQQLLDILSNRFDNRFNSVDKKLKSMDKRFDGLESLINGIGDTVAIIADNMATRQEVQELETRMEVHMECLEARMETGFQSAQTSLDDAELRLGRRIDTALATAKTM